MQQIYLQHLPHYSQYIDDVFGIWIWTGTTDCISAWESLIQIRMVGENLMGL